MKTGTDDTTSFARYLAGEMEHSEAQALEERILRDDDLFEHCMAVETEMVDAWIRGELGPNEVPGLMQLLGTSSRLQRTFQTTLGLDASRSANLRHNQEDGNTIHDTARLGKPPRSNLAVGLFGGVIGSVLAAGLLWVYTSQQLTRLTAELEQADAERTQLGAAVEQQRQANAILQRELAQLEAAQRPSTATTL